MYSIYYNCLITCNFSICITLQHYKRMLCDLLHKALFGLIPAYICVFLVLCKAFLASNIINKCSIARPCTCMHSHISHMNTHVHMCICARSTAASISSSDSGLRNALDCRRELWLANNNNSVRGKGQRRHKLLCKCHVHVMRVLRGAKAKRHIYDVYVVLSSLWLWVFVSFR